MAEHHLKCHVQYFDAIARGEKNFEVRRNDRDFQLGDVLILHRYDPRQGYRFVELRRRVTYVLPGGQFGIEPDYVVLALGDEVPA